MAVLPEFGLTPLDIAFHRLTDYGVDPPTVVPNTQTTYDAALDLLIIPERLTATSLSVADFHLFAEAVGGFNELVLRKLRPPRTAYPTDAEVRVVRQPDGDVLATVDFGAVEILNARYRAIQNDVRFPAIPQRQMTWSAWMISATAVMQLSAQIGGQNAWYH